MSAPKQGERTSREVLARERQQCQAEGLRALAELIELDERVSQILAFALPELRHHLLDGDGDDLRYFAAAAVRAGAELVTRRTGPDHEVIEHVELRWSEHFGVALQCFASLTEPDQAGP